MGTRSCARPGHKCCHICRETRPCSRLTPLTWADSRMASAVMLNPCPALSGSFAETEELFARKAELSPIVVEVSIHQVKREYVMTGWDRRVSGEDGALPDEIAGFSMALTGGDELADSLQRQEGGMPFIAMPHGRIDAERAEDSHTADA